VKNTSLIIHIILSVQLLLHVAGWICLKSDRQEKALERQQPELVGKFVADEAALEAKRVAAKWAAAEAERIAIEKAAAEKAAAEKRRVRDAITRAEAFLLTMQQPNGAFYDSKSRFVRHGYAMTSLSLLALADSGHKPIDLNMKGIAMTRGLDFVLSEDPRLHRSGGYFGVEGSRMYGHGITTLCLTTMMRIGVHPRQEARLREVNLQAVELILKAQRTRKSTPRYVGGWRYTPTSQDSDLSISIWQILALVSARKAGINVPKESIDLAVRYLKRSYFSGRNARGIPIIMSSGFGYLPGQRPEYAMTAAGLLGLQMCEDKLSPESKGSTHWLAKQELNPRTEWFYFGTYFYSQAMRGEEKNRQKTQEVLLGLQKDDGSWVGNSSRERAGRVYSTTLALASLNAVKQ
jgi:hypothetical protein